MFLMVKQVPQVESFSQSPESKATCFLRPPSGRRTSSPAGYCKATAPEQNDGASIVFFPAKERDGAKRDATV